MSEEELNIKYICNKTLLDEKDELVPIILKMLSEAYRKGLKQGKFDNEMKVLELQSVIDKAIKFIENNSPNLSNAEVYDLLEILRSKE